MRDLNNPETAREIVGDIYNTPSLPDLWRMELHLGNVCYVLSVAESAILADEIQKRIAAWQTNHHLTEEQPMKAKPKSRKLFIAVDDQYQILYVGWGPPPPGMVQGLFSLITDNEAEYLYIALSGHRFGNEADTYSLERAQTVRDFILEMEQVGHPVQTLCRVIERWGDKIDPWLGATRLEGTGLALDDPSDRTIALTGLATPVQTK